MQPPGKLRVPSPYPTPTDNLGVSIYLSRTYERPTEPVGVLDHGSIETGLTPSRLGAGGPEGFPNACGAWLSGVPCDLQVWRLKSGEPSVRGVTGTAPFWVDSPKPAPEVFQAPEGWANHVKLLRQLYTLLNG